MVYEFLMSKFCILCLYAQSWTDMCIYVYVYTNFQTLSIERAKKKGIPVTISALDTRMVSTTILT
jgi:hypothetical protein